MDAKEFDTLRSVLESFEGGLAGEKVLCVRAPGRTEIAGNHTDHEGGHVIAAALDRYVFGIFRPNGRMVARVKSEGYDAIEVDLTSMDPRDEEKGTTAALVRGLAACVAEQGYEVAGFDAAIRSDVPAGSGLSSSAAFELLIARALSGLWANGELSRESLALMSQRAEREWFGKPCGLMDQAAVALGGVQFMSFADPGSLEAESIDFDFSEHGYGICLVAVGSSHADLIDEYAAVPGEMQAIARACGAERLGDVLECNFAEQMPELRELYGDRAVLRAIHYFREERLVKGRVQALKSGDIASFLHLTHLSGVSSGMYLQNVSLWGAEQPAMIALAAADEMLTDKGVSRIHGGGFGGTIQAFVPTDVIASFTKGMEHLFGPGSCEAYGIDHEGVTAEWL
ncbi:MAG: galactokinase [Atopobiaceae bacterium]|nr:galactokinase [Atopobiaceae bacterium]